LNIAHAGAAGEGVIVKYLLLLFSMIFPEFREIK
jgi:hypothetical protein